MSELKPQLKPEIVAAAAAELEGTSRFWFTRRNLMFELCRRQAWAEPGVSSHLMKSRMMERHFSLECSLANTGKVLLNRLSRLLKNSSR